MATNHLLNAACSSQLYLIVWRPLKGVGTRRAAGLEHFQLMLELPVARREQLDLALLSDHGIIEVNQRTLEVSQLDLDLVEARWFGHHGTQTVATRIHRLG
jgi:hypothetical protein